MCIQDDCASPSRGLSISPSRKQQRKNGATKTIDDDDECFKPSSKNNDVKIPVVSVSRMEMTIVMIFTIGSSFLLGSLSRNFVYSYIVPADLSMTTSSDDSNYLIPNNMARQWVNDEQESTIINLPKIPGEKKAPENKYTYKQFDATNVVRSYSVLLPNDNTSCNATTTETYSYPVTVFETDGKEIHTSFETPITDEHNNNNNKIHEPSGQHLLVDIENVNTEFLNSEERLATAMIQLIQMSSLTLLSYHCHGLEPSGVSCVGVLLESHVSFHTWPMKGVITLDLFTCGSNPLLPLLPSIKELFGIPGFNPPTDEEFRGEVEDLLEEPPEPRLIWGHKRRGFRTPSADTVYNLDDFDFHWLLGSMELEKENIASVKTKFQQIDIYDVVQQRFREYGQSDIPRDRLVYLDGILQSRTYGETAYHEALVHPAMFTHDNPRRVVIIGGGEGATLREVLKHSTVEEVIMVEIDEQMVSVSKQYLPGWSDCSNLIGSADSCFDDPRAKIYFEDAIAWFVDRFGDNATVSNEDPIDIIIMDALDPNSVVEFSDLLYDNIELVKAFSRALGKEGIFIAQTGEVDHMDDPPEILDGDTNYSTFLNGLMNVGFESIMDYDEAHGRFQETWSFLLAMKDSDARTNWFMNEAEMQLEILNRAMETKNGQSPFLYFDGATMMQYQFPSRVNEETWCRDHDGEECGSGHGFDPYIEDNPLSSFEVKPSAIAGGGRGVFATRFIPKGAYIGLEDCVHGMFVPPTTHKILSNTAETLKTCTSFWDVVYWGYVEGYGWVDSIYGEPAAGVDPGILTFVNHGCNGSYNVGTRLNETEATIEFGRGPADVYDDGNDVYHPFFERHYPLWGCAEFVALRDIQKGEEILDNYLVFGGGADEDDWEDNLLELKEMCSGGAGRITKYESAAMNVQRKK